MAPRYWSNTSLGTAVMIFLDGINQVAQMVKNPTANAGAIREAGLIPGLAGSPGGGHSNPPQYSCLENPMDRGAWRATVHRLRKSRTRPVTEGARSVLLCLWLLWVGKMSPGHTHVVASAPLG